MPNPYRARWKPLMSANCCGVLPLGGTFGHSAPYGFALGWGAAILWGQYRAAQRAGPG